ncbi:MAG: carboxy terminal-processing peptidase, partial [Bacteroidota bacterium]
IEEGPIVQVKSKIAEKEILEDLNASVAYDGPLIVMVNEFSASASEILSAALQDYDRAVIVGSKATFGKGTVQRILDMDRYIRGNEEFKPLGDIKVTMQKFYRVNGGSVQLKGVVPDVVLPSTYQNIEIGERDQDNPMDWSEIDPLEYDQQAYVIGDQMSTLQANSKERVAGNETFQKIISNAKRYSTLRETSVYPLNLETYRKMVEKRDAEADKYKNLMDEVINNGVANMEVDLELVNKNEKNQKLNKDFIEGVSKDVYIHESLMILHDMISMN